jgi:transposase
LKFLVEDEDFEWLMIDATHVKAHPPRRGSIWRKPRYGAHKRGLNPKIHLAVDAHGAPVEMFVTAGTTADCKFGENLINGIDAENLLADRGFDTDTIVEVARAAGMNVVIPPKKNRKIQREYDKAIYKLRHLVENSFPKLKRFRAVATRYAKTTSCFRGAIVLGSILQWLQLNQ